MKLPVCLALVFVAALGASGCASDVDKCVSAGLRLWEYGHGKVWPWSTPSQDRLIYEMQIRNQCLLFAAGTNVSFSEMSK